MVAPVAIYADPVSILVWASLFSVLAIGSLLIAQIITRKSGNATLKRAALYTVTALSAYLAIGMFIRLITHKPIVELTEKSIRIDPPAAITIVIPWYAVEEIRTVLSCKRMFVREVAAIQTSQQFFDAQLGAAGAIACRISADQQQAQIHGCLQRLACRKAVVLHADSQSFETPVLGESANLHVPTRSAAHR